MQSETLLSLLCNLQPFSHESVNEEFNHVFLKGYLKHKRVIQVNYNHKSDKNDFLYAFI